MNKNTLILPLLFFALTGCTQTNTGSSKSITSTSTTSDVTSMQPFEEEIKIEIEKNIICIGESLTYKVYFLHGEQNYRVTTDKKGIVNVSNNTIKGLDIGKVNVYFVADSGISNSVSIEVRDFKDSKILSDLDYANEQGKTEYLVNAIPTTTSAGLIRGNYVGVNKDSFLNDIKYPIINEKFAKVYKASDYEILPNGDDISIKLNSLLLSLKNVSGNKIISFESGTYIIGNLITIDSLNDLYLKGNNSRFIANSFMSYVFMNNCSNIHLNDIVFDSNPSPTVSGKVLSSYSKDGYSYVIVEVNDKFNMSNPAYNNFSVYGNNGVAGSYAEYTEDKNGNIYPNINSNLYYTIGVKGNEASGLVGLTPKDNNQLEVKLTTSFPPTSGGKFKEPQKGTLVAVSFRVYENYGFYFSNSNDIFVENINVYVTSGMGCRCDACNNIYFNQFNFVRENNERLLTCGADILHICNCTGDFDVSNSILEGSHDDAINLKTYYTSISNVQSKSLTVKQTNNETIIQFDVGDIIDIFDPDTLEKVKTYTISDVEKIGSTFTLSFENSIAKSLVKTGYLVANASKAPTIYLENVVIANKRNRGILLQGRNSILKNVTFLNVIHGAMQIFGNNADNFKEGIIPNNILLENCKFINNISPIQVYAIGKSGHGVSGTIDLVTIRNTIFYNNSGKILDISNAKNINIESNMFCENFNTKSSIYLNQVSSVNIYDNYYLPIDKKPNDFNFIKYSNTENLSVNNNIF